MKVGIVMAKEGQDLMDVAAVLEEAVVLTDLNDFTECVGHANGFSFCPQNRLSKGTEVHIRSHSEGPHEHWWRTVFLTCGWFKKQTSTEDLVRLCSDDSSHVSEP